MKKLSLMKLNFYCAIPSLSHRSQEPELQKLRIKNEKLFKLGYTDLKFAGKLQVPHENSKSVGSIGIQALKWKLQVCYIYRDTGSVMKAPSLLDL